MRYIDWGLLLSAVVAVATTVKVFSDFLNSRRVQQRVLDAEKEAYRSGPERGEESVRQTTESQDALKKDASDLAELVERSQQSLRVGRLFDLYSKQVEKYQTETQSRAGWSFLLAIVAMFAGLGFVVWGGAQIVLQGPLEHRVGSAAIAAIGAALSGFITKTFLDVHRLSLTQLNRYFRQPVINSHILTAQRLADQLPDSVSKQKAYEQIITAVVRLVREELDTRGDDLLSVQPAFRRRQKKAAKSATQASAGQD